MKTDVNMKKTDVNIASLISVFSKTDVNITLLTSIFQKPMLT